MKEFLNEPLAVEALVALVLTILFYLAIRGLRGVAVRVSRRKALTEFVTGVDLFFKGEFEAARDALSKVIERDPENCEARILLGDACRELGDVAEAHKHHYQVARIFGQDLPRNRLSLGTDLLMMGKPEASIQHLARALESDPGDRHAADLLLKANLSAGRLDDAIALARRLTESAPTEAEAVRSRRLHARVCAHAGHELVEQGNQRDGVQLLKNAIRLNECMVSPRLEIVRAAYVHGSARSAERELMSQLRDMSRLAEEGMIFEPPIPLPGAAPSESRGEAAALPAPDAAVALPEPSGRVALPAPGASTESGGGTDTGKEGEAREEGGERRLQRSGGRHRMARGERMPDAPLAIEAGRFVTALLPREAAYVCAECGQPELAYAESCTGCGSFSSLTATDEAALTTVPGMKEALDEIQENRAYLRSLVRLAATGEPASWEKLCSAGGVAVKAIFRELLRVPDHSALVQILAEMGPAVVPEILDAWRRASAFSTKKLVRERMRAFKSLDGVMVRIFYGMGPDVVPALDELLEEGGRDGRMIALDVLIRLGEAERVEELRPEVSQKEILDRLNGCPAEELVEFIRAAPVDGYLVEQILVDRTFLGDRALVGALGMSGDRGKVRRILMERGFSSDAYDSMEARWGEGAVRTLVSDVIRSYGRQASDHLVKTCLTFGVEEEVKSAALLLLRDLGGGEIERFTERLADGDSESERAVLGIVRAFGNRAVAPLERAYGKGGLLRKVGLNRRRQLHRKITLARALGQIGTHEAIQSLNRLCGREGDPDLKRRLRTILDRLARKGDVE